MKVSRHALTFTVGTLRHATKLGIPGGMAKAATKVNPALLVVEAAISVLDAAQSFFALETAKTIRDGLRAALPLERERLEAERKKLENEVAARGLELEVVERQNELVMKVLGVTLDVFGQIAALYHELSKDPKADYASMKRCYDDLETSWQLVRQRVIEMHT